VALALITPALFSRPPDPLPHREKRERLVKSNTGNGLGFSCLSPLSL
jgi:hypothetical protein